MVMNFSCEPWPTLFVLTIVTKFQAKFMPVTFALLNRKAVQFVLREKIEFRMPQHCDIIMYTYRPDLLTLRSCTPLLILEL